MAVTEYTAFPENTRTVCVVERVRVVRVSKDSFSAIFDFGVVASRVLDARFNDTVPKTCDRVRWTYEEFWTSNGGAPAEITYLLRAGGMGGLEIRHALDIEAWGRGKAVAAVYPQLGVRENLQHYNGSILYHHVPERVLVRYAPRGFLRDSSGRLFYNHEGKWYYCGGVGRVFFLPANPVEEFPREYAEYLVNLDYRIEQGAVR
jgi:hypothetical protein